MHPSIFNSIFFPIVELRNYFFDHQIIKIVKSPIPVISIGNISFGGAGKTPLTIKIAQKLVERGRKPIVLSSGYKRKSRGIFVIDQNKQFNPEEVGDEVILIHRKAKIPIVVSKPKYKAADFIAQNFSADTILVDDGFQHRKLFRDLDIVLIDKRTIGGLKREPLRNLRRASIVLLEYGLNPQVIPKGNFIIFQYRKYIKNFLTIDYEKIDIEKYKDRAAVLISGIGNNENFLLATKDYFPNIAKHFSFKDHHFYQARDIDKILLYLKENGINLIITTEKDFIKLEKFRKKFVQEGIEIVISELEIEISNEEELISIIEQAIKTTKE